MEETALKIKVFPDPVLRRKSRPVVKVTDSHRRVLSEMARIMYENSGIGLAAPQVGVSETMIVVDIGNGLYKLINPRVIKRSGRQQLEEGCLSVPGVCLKIKRAKCIKVRGLDESAKPVAIEAEGLLACVFQHEIDHLKGKLIVDHASFLDKFKIKRKLKKLKEKAKNERVREPETKSCKLQL